LAEQKIKAAMVLACSVAKTQNNSKPTLSISSRLPAYDLTQLGLLGHY
jgi:hypothetical protein